MSVCVCDVVWSNHDMYVSHSGSDVPLCGTTNQPCATLRYALSQHSNVSQVYWYIH